MVTLQVLRKAQLYHHAPAIRWILPEGHFGRVAEVDHPAGFRVKQPVRPGLPRLRKLHARLARREPKLPAFCLNFLRIEPVFAEQWGSRGLWHHAL